MPLLKSLFGHRAKLDQRQLYDAVVKRARLPHWYVEGGVADTIDGRFDMVAAVLSLVLLRLEKLDAPEDSARLAEIFVEDMDGQLRQIGIGDLVVGKHIGRMMGALGGRLTAYRAAMAGTESFEEALVRNLYRGERPEPGALDHSVGALRRFADDLDREGLDALRAGRLPPA